MEQDNSFIGDIKYSILEPKNFTDLHPAWVLLSGQTIDINSGLGKLGITKIPDARGVFLRGMNVGREMSTGDVEGDNRAVGSYQEDQYKAHRHSIPGPAAVGNIINNNINFFNEPVRRSDPIYTNEEGGQETRPRNITVYIYIKIN